MVWADLLKVNYFALPEIYNLNFTHRNVLEMLQKNIKFLNIVRLHQKRKKKCLFTSFAQILERISQMCVFTSSAFRSSGFGTELASRHYKSLFGQSNLSICAQISPTGRGEWMWYILFSNKKINFIHRNWNKIVFRLLPMWWTLLKWQKSKDLFSLDFDCQIDFY